MRLVSVSDQMELTEFHEAFRAILGWSGNLDYIFRVHGQEFNSFHRITRSKLYASFNCIDRGSSSTFATRSTCGNGMFESSISRPRWLAIAYRSAWAVGAPRRRSFAAVLADIV